MTAPEIQLPKSGRRPALALLVTTGVAFVAAALVGISDNPPGLILAYLGCICLILALVYRWNTVRTFVYLLVGSIAGLLLAAVLHNLLYALAEMAEGIAIMRATLEGLHAGAFLVAIFLCPAGILVGAVGALVMWRRERWAG